MTAYRYLWACGANNDEIKHNDQTTCAEPSRATSLLPLTFMPSSIDSSSISSYDSDEEYRLAQEEWEESLEQLKQLVSVVLLPFVGKWMGRRWSHWGLFVSSDLFFCQLTIACSIRTLSPSRLRKGIFSWRTIPTNSMTISNVSWVR